MTDVDHDAARLRGAWLKARGEYFEQIERGSEYDNSVLRDRAYEAAEAVHKATGVRPRATDPDALAYEAARREVSAQS